MESFLQEREKAMDKIQRLLIEHDISFCFIGGAVLPF